jgi:hypothetical protein
MEKKRRREKKETKKKKEVSDTHKSFDDETFNIIEKISTRRIHKHHEKPTSKLVIRC